MSNEYKNRSRVVYEATDDEEMRIGTLKAQTGWAIDEATAKNLLSQAKLKKALENQVPDSVEHKKIDKALKELRTNWRELNYLKKATFWNPKPWDDEWEFMEHLIALVQKIRGHQNRDKNVLPKQYFKIHSEDQE